MTNYKDSFQLGISAAEQAEANKKEISEVFKELNKQIAEITDGKISIERIEFYEPMSAFKIPLFDKRTTYWTIAAKNVKAASENKELAKWNLDRAGYPCKITLGKYEIYCEDKVALETALSNLLKDPIVGGILYKLMQLPDKEAQEPPRVL